jgi:hypothetical protein
MVVGIVWETAFAGAGDNEAAEEENPTGTDKAFETG